MVKIQATIAGAIVAALLSSPCPAAVADPNTAAKVTHVFDGDTLIVGQGKASRRVKLYGVDCPERTQPFGKRAKKYMAKMVLGKQVTLEVLPGGRGEARVYVKRDSGIDHHADGTHARKTVIKCLNEELVRAGLAWWDRRHARADAALAGLEANARAAKRGLWAAKAPLPPHQWEIGQRRRPSYKDRACKVDADCVLVRMHPRCPCACGRHAKTAVNKKAAATVRQAPRRNRCRCLSRFFGTRAECIGGQCLLASTPAAASGAAQTPITGVPACDTYLAKFAACLKKVPEASRPMMERALKMTREAWKKAAATRNIKPQMQRACTTAIEVARKSMATFKCDW